MTAQLAHFLAPILPADVLTRNARKNLRVQAGKADRANLDLISWDRLKDMAMASDTPFEVRFYSNRNRVPAAFFESDGVPDRAKIDRFVDRGASVMMESAHRFDDNLGAVVREFMDQGGKPVRLAAIGSTGTAGALPRHTDPIDLFVRQIEGAKLWRIYAPEDENNDGARPVLEHVLRPGEYLFVPAGMPHECDTIEGNSLHLTLGFMGSSYDVWG